MTPSSGQIALATIAEIIKLSRTMHHLDLRSRVDSLSKNYKSVLSFLRQLTTWHCPHLLLRAVLRLHAAGHAAIDRPPARRAHSSKPAAACRVRPANGTDRKTDRHTDGRTPYRHIDSALYTMRAVPNNTRLSDMLNVIFFT